MALAKEFDFAVGYKSGRHHADADCLSRLPLPTSACDADNFNEFLAAIDDILFPDLAIFREEQRDDHSLDALFASAAQPTGKNGFDIQDSLPYKTNYAADGTRLLLVVPTNLRTHVLRAMHDDSTAGHLGFTRTYNRIQGRFYWTSMQRDIEK
ncbi:uncharacterized protein [Dermacentor andersoni]|uniref:uncharacterized protein n=1 Tax=Dermacentor andersoni TaxID=34620 RepID=UPI003B3A97D7